ncbi:MAG TPA: hypothetical protein DDY81_02220 [Clostridiales bacterium]|nr:hypothetical protein [Clostridiales bacterium]
MAEDLTLLYFTTAPQTIQTSHPQISNMDIVHHISPFVKRKVKKLKMFLDKESSGTNDRKKPPEKNSGGGWSN